MKGFDIHMHCELITTVNLINISSHLITIKKAFNVDKIHIYFPFYNLCFWVMSSNHCIIQGHEDLGLWPTFS